MPPRNNGLRNTIIGAVVGVVIGILGTLSLFAPRVMAHNMAIERNAADIQACGEIVQSLMRDMITQADLDRLKADLVRELGGGER